MTLKLPMAPDRADQSGYEQALAERHKPLLILYPEISSETRRVRADWREAGLPPLYEDYRPRDIKEMALCSMAT